MLCHLNETIQPIHFKYYSVMVQRKKKSYAAAIQKQATLNPSARGMSPCRHPRVILIVSTAHNDVPLMQFFGYTNPIFPFPHASNVRDGA